MIELPPMQQALYDRLADQGDVDIQALHAIVRPGVKAEQREAQQCLGPYFTRLNRRLKNQGKSVKPGRLKGTYCLVTL